MASLIDSQRNGSFGLAKLSDGVRANSDAKTQAGLGRGPNQSKKLVNAAWTNTFPAQGATLDLDFANDRGYVRGVGQGRSMDAVTFTRASNGTFVKPDGTLSQHSNQGALGNNLLTFPQDFNDAAWLKTASTVIANAEIAPDGTLTADKVINGTGGGSTASFVNQNNGVIPPTTTGVFSVYAKAGELNIIALGADTYNDGFSGAGQRVWFNLLDETIFNSPSAAGATGSISSVGNGWYRCSIVFNTFTGSGAFRCFPASTNGSINTTQNGSGIFIWGAQLELGSTATQYFPTNINVPRFDWASTAQLDGNLLINSDYPTSWGYAGVTPTYNATTDPEGTNNAVLLTETGNSSHTTSFAASLIAGNTYTISAYFKDNNRRYAGIAISNFNNFNSNFDLTNVLAVSGAGNTSSIVSVGNGWYRCSMTFTATTTVISNALFGLSTSASGGTPPYISEGKSLYLYAPQVNLGSVATTYLKTGAQPTSNTPLLANPTSNGLLIEESRANRLLWCRDATQTNWIKLNITAAKDQTGIDGVASSASSLTATLANGTCIQTITLSSGLRTNSVYLKRITGTGAIQVTLDGTTYSTVNLSTSEWRRIVLSGTVTNPTVGIRIVTSGDAVAMDFGQVEDGAFVTTPILTTTASVTRSADAASMTGNNFDGWYVQGKGTITSTFFDSPSTGVNFSISNSSVANNIKINRPSATSIRVDVSTASNLSYAIATSSIPNPNSFNTTCFGYINYNAFFSVSGQTPITETSLRARIIPTNFNVFRIGADANGASTATTYINRIFYIPQKLADNALQVITGGAT